MRTRFNHMAQEQLMQLSVKAERGTLHLRLACMAQKLRAVRRVSDGCIPYVGTGRDFEGAHWTYDVSQVENCSSSTPMLIGSFSLFGYYAVIPPHWEARPCKQHGGGDMPLDMSQARIARPSRNLRGKSEGPKLRKVNSYKVVASSRLQLTRRARHQRHLNHQDRFPLFTPASCSTLPSAARSPAAKMVKTTLLLAALSFLQLLPQPKLAQKSLTTAGTISWKKVSWIYNILISRRGVRANINIGNRKLFEGNLRRTQEARQIPDSMEHAAVPLPLC